MSRDRVLVANRGEIAVRIIRSVHALGLEAVAVFSDADRGAPHVDLADAAVRLGPAAPAESYLVAERIVAAALDTGAGIVHPGYGLLSEDAAFARAVEAAGLVFAGPTPEQLEAFGAKDRARALARAAGVPMLAGTDTLPDAAAAVAAAETIGYPVMVKATGGGGGIGLAVCHDAAQLRDAYDRVRRAAASNFGTGGVFLERYVTAARHVEVQVFGDGHGRVVSLGDRDCTLQRRNQKVVEEAPAPALPAAVRTAIAAAAVDLCAAAGYRSAGTVEFVYDAARQEAAFLEVNARLQVEHPVTEGIHGDLDLVAWMLRLARGDRSMLDAGAPPAAGHAVEARIYAEDPGADHRPSPGLITAVRWPAGLRVDGWVHAGTEVTGAYDPLLAKVVATGPTRDAALDALADGLRETRVEGIATNLPLLRAALADPALRGATHTTATLADVAVDEARIDVVRGGTLTTVQAWPGRRGLWHVGVPPSGPMDDRSLRLVNAAVGNPEGAPALECTLQGPALRFSAATTVCVGGAQAPVTLDGVPVPQWTALEVGVGGVLDVGPATTRGLRTYVAVAGGIDVPEHLGSAATFTLGRFGGHGGRELRPGDVLRPGGAPVRAPVPVHAPPELANAWTLAVLEGPHAAPEFFTPEDVEMVLATDWQVHHNSARTGVRLVGPRPAWARADGGEAGLHPSNIHDTPYSVGAVDFTGDVPILLGPDGPSLGGFVCPVTVVSGERWKLGQLRPGDTVRFVLVDEAAATALRRPAGRAPSAGRAPDDGGVLARREAGTVDPSVTYRRSGDDNLLIEYGDMRLDLGLRLRIHALAERLAAEAPRGVVDVTPGIRSLQVHVDPDALGVRSLLGLVQALEDDLPPTTELEVPSRVVHLPLSWDDPATREATERYMAGVRDDAPWCPWNIEFIRRVNGLDSVEEVRRIVYDASYLVLGLGDVYLGAPVATPLDPRHRLVTTKYNPARTWTPENAVGIGGAYLCVYGMEGPGGYQFVGRTVQVWNRWRRSPAFEDGVPWLLRFFDRIRWHPVGAQELLEQRAEMEAGRLEIATEPGTFRLADHLRFLDAEADSIAAFGATQGAAFAAERAAWAAAGEFDPRPDPAEAPPPEPVDAPPGGALVEAPLSASVWKVHVEPGEAVQAGQRMVTLEAMKMETALEAPIDGEVVAVLAGPGDQLQAGSPVVVLAGAA